MHLFLAVEQVYLDDVTSRVSEEKVIANYGQRTALSHLCMHHGRSLKIFYHVKLIFKVISSWLNDNEAVDWTFDKNERVL
jgi:hypothetical protein